MMKLEDRARLHEFLVTLSWKLAQKNIRFAIACIAQPAMKGISRICNYVLKLHENNDPFYHTSFFLRMP